MRLSLMRLIMYLYMKERSHINEYHTTRKRTNQASLLHVNQGIPCFPCDQPDLIVEELTPTEKQILEKTAAGKKRKEIAGELYISERTLSNHLQHIYEKLGVSSSIEAVTKALQMGYIAPL